MDGENERNESLSNSIKNENRVKVSRPERLFPTTEEPESGVCVCDRVCKVRGRGQKYLTARVLGTGATVHMLRLLAINGME